jgi:hypothetical protein
MSDTTIKYNPSTLPTTPDKHNMSNNNSPKIPYCWDMYHIKLYHRQNHRGGHFFSPGAMRGFSSRLQNLPPYNGRVFVTSEKASWKHPRLYTIRYLRCDGSIETVYGHQAFQSRGCAHHIAKLFAQANFRQEGAFSIANKEITFPV